MIDGYRHKTPNYFVGLSGSFDSGRGDDLAGLNIHMQPTPLMALIWTGQSRLGEATFPAPKGTEVREGGRLVTSDGQPSLVHSLCVDPILKWTVFTLASGFGCILVGGGIAARLFEVEVRDGFKIGAWTTGLLAGIAILPIFLAVTIGLVAL